MQIQSVCGLQQFPKVPSSFIARNGSSPKGRLGLILPAKSFPRRGNLVSYLPNSENSPPPNSKPKLVVRSGSPGRIRLDPFRGKPGSVSFCGLTYQSIEARKLVSTPFADDIGSFVWVVGPIALLSSLLVPQLVLGYAVEAIFRDEIIAEIVASFLSEIIFYAGLATFLYITNRVQRPYLDFSPKRWSLITGLRGYLSSVFFTMGFKVLVPLLAAYVFWPTMGLPAAIVVAPFLLGCAVQFGFELTLDKHNISCWPLLPIIFELYRLYQLNKGAHFLERLMFSLRGAPMTPELLERSGAVFSMITVLQSLGFACLWSLTTFLLRLFPSRPVAENY